MMSPHVLCCGVLPFLGAFGAELLPWVDNLWAKLAIAVFFTVFILLVDDLFHKKSKAPHVGACATMHGKKGTSLKKYVFWILFALIVTSGLHMVDIFYIHDH